MVNPQTAAANWKKGMAGAADKIRAGVSAVQEAPTQAAIRAIPRQVDGVIRAAADGRTQLGLERVTLQDWKTAMIDKGLSRVATGAAQAEGKMAAFLSVFLPFVQQGVDALKSTPRGDLETNIGRMNQMVRHLAGFRRSR